MTKKLLTQNIAFDTSFIESQNFLAGSKINDLSKLCKDKSIKLFMTDITFREIISRFNENLKQTSEKIIKPREQLTSSARLLRNFADFANYFDFQDISVKKLSKRFYQSFTDWIKENNITIITTDHITIKPVFDDYFDKKLPFKDGKKKHEFPDAFSLYALTDYFKKHNSKAYLLTLDKDLEKSSNDLIIAISDSSSLIDLIIRTLPEILVEKAIKLIEIEFKKYNVELSEKLYDLIYKKIEEEVNTTYEVEGLLIDSLEEVDLSEIELGKYSIVSLNMDTNNVKIECEITFSFKAAFTAEDFSDAWFDKEDKVWHFLELKTFNIDDTLMIPTLISGKIDLESKIIYFEIENINNDNKLDVFQSLNPWKL